MSDQNKIGNVSIGFGSDTRTTLNNLAKVSVKQTAKINTLVHSLYVHDSSGKGGVRDADSRYTLATDVRDLGVSSMLTGIDGTSIFTFAGNEEIGRDLTPTYLTLHPIFYKIDPVDSSLHRPHTVYETFVSLMDWVGSEISNLELSFSPASSCITDCAYTKSIIGERAFTPGGALTPGSIMENVDKLLCYVEQIREEAFGETYTFRSYGTGDCTGKSTCSLNEKVDAILTALGASAYVSGYTSSGCSIAISPVSSSLNKFVLVETEADLPAPGGSGYIELEDGYTYLFTSNVTVTSQIRVNGTNTLIGGAGVGGVQFNLGTSDPGFDVYGANLLLIGGSWQSQTGDVFRVNSNSSLTCISSVIVQVSYSAEAVKVDTSSALVATNTLFSGTRSGIYLAAGSHQTTRIQIDGGALSGGTGGLLIDGSATKVAATFNGCRFDTDRGATWIRDDSGGSAIDDLLLTGCMFRGSGQLSNISPQQSQVVFRGCTFSQGGHNTRSFASTYAYNNSSATSFGATNTWETVELTGGSTGAPTSPGALDFLTADVVEYTYNGAPGQLLELTAVLDITDHSGTIDVDFGWTFGGTLVGSPVTAHLHGGASHEVVVKAIVIAEQGAYTLQTRNQTNTNGITVRNGTITAIGMG